MFVGVCCENWYNKYCKKPTWCLEVTRSTCSNNAGNLGLKEPTRSFTKRPTCFSTDVWSQKRRSCKLNMNIMDKWYWCQFLALKKAVMVEMSGRKEEVLLYNVNGPQTNTSHLLVVVQNKHNDLLFTVVIDRKLSIKHFIKIRPMCLLSCCFWLHFKYISEYD